jgi:hypothetical protein
MRHVAVQGGVLAAAHSADLASFTLTEEQSADPRTVTVPSIEMAVDGLAERIARWPIAATVCDDVLRVRFNRPRRHNAFSTDARAALLDALEVARLDPSVTEVVLTGNGEAFCSGGDLAELGSFTDPATAHVSRTRHSPGLVLDEITIRLGQACRAEVHGQVLGSGLEMAAFCGYVTCRPRRHTGAARTGARPDPRRGRHGERHPADRSLVHGVSRSVGEDHRPATALDWGLVDEVG